jgi:hypothetical protein
LILLTEQLPEGTLIVVSIYEHTTAFVVFVTKRVPIFKFKVILNSKKSLFVGALVGTSEGSIEGVREG